LADEQRPLCLQVSELSSRVDALSKEKDSALGKMSLWMKTCKKLQQEMLVQNPGIKKNNNNIHMLVLM